MLCSREFSCSANRSRFSVYRFLAWNSVSQKIVKRSFIAAGLVNESESVAANINDQNFENFEVDENLVKSSCV